MTYYTANDLVNIIDELNICGCGCPEKVYKLIHRTMKEVYEVGVSTDATSYYDFMIYQLNHMEFLEHGSSIYGSYVTEKGRKLMEALDEMEKYDYDYGAFFENNLEEVNDDEEDEDE